MTKDDIIRMARESWISEKEAEMIGEFDGYLSCTYLNDLIRFADLVASAEREACAKLAEKEAQYSVAEAIRERSHQ